MNARTYAATDPFEAIFQNERPRKVAYWVTLAAARPDGTEPYQCLAVAVHDPLTGEILLADDCANYVGVRVLDGKVAVQ